MFYKNDNGILLKGLEILNENYHLTVDDTGMEIDGWQWFETEEEAKQALM